MKEICKQQQQEVQQLHRDIGHILMRELGRKEIHRGSRNVKRMLKRSESQPMIF